MRLLPQGLDKLARVAGEPAEPGSLGADAPNIIKMLRPQLLNRFEKRKRDLTLVTTGPLRLIAHSSICTGINCTMSNIINIRSNVNVQLHNIPTSLQQWDNWGIYRSDKKPITLASAINCTDIGFKINDLSAHGGSFEDAARIITTHDPEVRERVGRPPIVGPSLAIEERLETVVIDLDDPQYKLEQRREEHGGVLLGSNGKPMTDAEFARAVATETETHQMILRAFRGHYVETSMSGAGYHIFVRGRLGEEGGPIKRYRIGDYDLGLVFSTGSIYMTGDLIDGSSREILDGQSVLDEVDKVFHP